MGELLRDRVAIVTGAGRGLGRAYALSMAGQGAKVVVNDPGVATDGTGASGAPADEVVEEIVAAGGEAAPSYDSVATSEGVERLLNVALAKFGRLDILVNNAGILRDRTIVNMTDDEWDAVIKVHLYGTFYCLRAAVRVMRDQGYGRIINIASASGLGATGQANYAAAKEGIIGLTRTASREFARYGINVNAIRPRAATRMNLNDEVLNRRRRVMSPEQFEQFERRLVKEMPLEGVAALVSYLASEKADFTGCVFEAYGNYVLVYADPPRIAGSICNSKGVWSPEKLVEVFPRTLLRNYQPPQALISVKLMPDAAGWEWTDGELRDAPPAVP